MERRVLPCGIKQRYFAAVNNNYQYAGVRQYVPGPVRVGIGTCFTKVKSRRYCGIVKPGAH